MRSGGLRGAWDTHALRCRQGRRRLCPECGSRWTTFERVQLRELTVRKSDGNKVIFDREKLIRSLQIALRKRPVDEGRIDRIVNSIQRQLETSGENEIPPRAIGEMVMDNLRELDQVAYVRFASVYKKFREAKDFEAFVEKMSDETEP